MILSSVLRTIKCKWNTFSATSNTVSRYDKLLKIKNNFKQSDFETSLVIIP